MLRVCYAEESDRDFIRWTRNLLASFLAEGSIKLVRQNDRPDLMLAGIRRPHPILDGVPVVLVSNESWKLFKPHAALDAYKAVIGVCPPPEPCANFISFPYAAVHFDLPMEQLHVLRNELLNVEKTHFCCFVSSNTAGELAAERVALFEVLHQVKHVNSAGKVRNNTGELAPRGIEFLRWIAKYRYMIALENSKEPGYLTEQPFQAWFAGTVPIYNGCLDALNPDAIVDVSAGDPIAKIQALEQDRALYEAKRRAPLTLEPPSLAAFQERFRALVLDGKAPKPAPPPHNVFQQPYRFVLRPHAFIGKSKED